MEQNLDESKVLETSTSEGETVETPEQKIERLEKVSAELESKNKQLFERVKKTESREAEVQLGNLQPRDAVLLAKADIHAEDIDEIVAFADYRKIPIAEALKNDTMNAILKDRVEKRKTAQATTINPVGRQAPRETPESIVELASQGQLPDGDDAIDRLAASRIAMKKAAKQR